jgi:hypothetical protein
MRASARSIATAFSDAIARKACEMRSSRATVCQ